MARLEHMGYAADAEFDEIDGIFVGHLIGTKDIVGFHGKTMEELEAALRESVESYIAISRELNRVPR